MEVIDVASKTIVQRMPTGAEPEGVINSVDGKYIFVTSEVADMVDVIDSAKAAVIKNIIVGTRPRRFVVTPDGAELWVSDELSSEVYVIDIAHADHQGRPNLRAAGLSPPGCDTRWHDDHQGWLQGADHAGAGQPSGDCGRQNPASSAICAGGQPRLGCGPDQRRENRLRDQWSVR